LGREGSDIFNPDFAVGIVARRRKPKRNAQLERFCDAGIIIIMLRSKIAKQVLQQGFASRSRWLLQILGLKWVTGRSFLCSSVYIRNFEVVFF
jgi:hypothetical protein